MAAQSKSQRPLDVIGVGSPLLDVLAFVDDAFLAEIGAEKGGMVLVDDAGMAELRGKLKGEVRFAPGGSAANTVHGLARLGDRCSFIGKLGADQAASQYRAAFSAAGVEVGSFRTSQEVATGQCLGLITPDSQRTFRTNLGAAATLTPAEIAASDFAATRHVHVEGYLLFNEALARKVLTAAKEAGCTTSIDLASFEVVQAAKAVLPELFEQVDIVFANEDEARAWCNSDDPEVGLDSLAEHCPLAVVKIGKAGAWCRNEHEQVFAPGAVAQAIDTTGAGDLWAAGFLHGWLRGRPLTECGGYGAILGAAVVEVIGAVIPNETWTHIKEHIQ